MPRHQLFVRLGETRYRVERPWGEVPKGQGVPSDVACDAEGRVYVQLRQDPMAEPGTNRVDIPAAVSLWRDASGALGLLQGGVGDAEAACHLALRGHAARRHGGDHNVIEVP